MKKIIVVDDSSTARAQVRNALAPAGYEIVEATNGEDGLRMIDAHADAVLVVCDMNMPVLDGIEMLKAVPEHARSRLRFLILTALASESEPRTVAAAKALGVEAWIAKPFKPEALRAAVDQALR